MKFEFDPYKSESNKKKHGLDFMEAQALWQGKRVELAANIVDGQMRYAAIGRIAGVLHTVVITYVGATVRIISARQSNENEKAIYESQTKKA